MSLLLLDSKKKDMNIAHKVFERQFKVDSKLENDYDQRRKMRMMEDILYNIECLNIAIKYDADMIFKDHASWIYNLLVNRMKDLPEERINEQMVMHYKILDEVLKEELSENDAQKASYHLANAMQVTKSALTKSTIPIIVPAKDQLGDLLEQYIRFLLEGNRHSAGKLIDDAIKSGVNLENIYIDIFQKAMWAIGDMWHQNKISVDKEHYCTAVTQGIMAQLYSIIFSTPRKGRSILACCVGKELHEMGIRMLCDLFELNGWDSIYLGAAVPIEGILNSINENSPDLVALSVTMPHHLDTCREIVRAIRENTGFKDTKIAVGGRPFSLSPHLVENWEVDITAVSGTKLVKWANENF